MPYTPVQHQILVDYIFQHSKDEFAYWHNTQTHPPATIYYARPYPQWGNGFWPPIVNLIQELYNRNIDPTQGTIYIPMNTTRTTMCDGMATFFHIPIVQVGAFTPNANTVPYNMLMESIVPLGSPDVVRVNADAVYTRKELAICTSFTFGPPPTHVQLNQPMASHLHRLYMMFVFSWVAGRNLFKDAQRYTNVPIVTGHNIGAALVTNNGVVRAFALNSRWLNATYHAEVNLMQAFAMSTDERPRNAVIYTTLKPCHMCAGMITELLPDSTIIYAQNDPGAHAVGTAAPIGGIHQLGAPWKPIREYDPMTNNETHDNLGTHLTTIHTINGGSLTGALRLDESTRAMQLGQYGLALKRQKYAMPNVQPNRLEVVEVLNHIDPARFK